MPMLSDCYRIQTLPMPHGQEEFQSALDLARSIEYTMILLNYSLYTTSSISVRGRLRLGTMSRLSCFYVGILIDQLSQLSHSKTNHMILSLTALYDLHTLSPPSSYKEYRHCRQKGEQSHLPFHRLPEPPRWADNGRASNSGIFSDPEWFPPTFRK